MELAKTFESFEKSKSLRSLNDYLCCVWIIDSNKCSRHSRSFSSHEALSDTPVLLSKKK